MPNFREQSPSKIAAGFGGTLNLVLSALYILMVVLLTALPCHFYLLSMATDIPPRMLQPGFLKLWLGLGLGGALILACVVTVLYRCAVVWRRFASWKFSGQWAVGSGRIA